MTTRRKFLKGAALAAPAAALATPAIAQSKIKWRLQTYAGSPLSDHVVIGYDPHWILLGAATGGKIRKTVRH